jgi:hypothetical protein
VGLKGGDINKLTAGLHAVSSTESEKKDTDGDGAA